jgi:hypothetical protein
MELRGAMKRYEYQAIEVVVSKGNSWRRSLLELLNAHGRDGWRVNNVVDFEPRDLITDEGERVEQVLIYVLLERASEA